jgi:hypothetical protein
MKSANGPSHKSSQSKWGRLRQPFCENPLRAAVRVAKNRRTCNSIRTGMPSQGRSCRRRRYQL